MFQAKLPEEKQFHRYAYIHTMVESNGWTSYDSVKEKFATTKCSYTKICSARLCLINVAPPMHRHFP